MASRRDQFIFYLMLTTPFLAITVKTAWLGDDAFITLRTVDQLLMGHGPVWNVGERVQAYTHPLWMLGLAASVLVTGEYFYTTLFLSMALSLGAFVILLHFVAQSRTGALVGALILILSKAFIDYSTSGLENPLTHLLLALFFALYFNGNPSLRNLFWLALLAGLGTLNRMDALLLYAPPLLYATWRLRGQGARVIAVLVGGLMPLLAWEVFSVLYYGFPFPNTAYAKLNTGLPKGEVIVQGSFYLLGTAGSDLLTWMVLLVGMLLPLMTRRRRELALAAGIALYLLYVVWIGGDFMMGRFLSAPLLCAVVPVVRYPYAAWRWQQAGLLLAGIVLLGLANPGQSPLLANADYNVAQIDNKGIADERGHYYQRYGLLSANRLNRLVEQGRVQGTTDPRAYAHCGIGLRGFSASPYTHIVDYCGLADPLLARLPAVHNPGWRVGHPLRTVPLGYMGVMRTGQNHLADPELAAYYDGLRTITRGRLFDPERLRLIWRMNSGQMNSLIDQERYRYPDRVTMDWTALQAYWAQRGEEGLDERVPFGEQGIRIELGAPNHADAIDVGMDLADFTVIYETVDDAERRQQRIQQGPLALDGVQFQVISVPADVADAGYIAVTILPQADGERALQHMAFHTTNEAANADLASLARRYAHAYYREKPPARAQQLDQIFAQLADLDLVAWQTATAGLVLDLMEIPVPALHSLLQERLSFETLVTEGGDPQLRYLGFSARQTGVDEPDRGVALRLGFEVLAPFAQEYTVWFHIVASKAESDNGAKAQYMIYDYAPMETTLDWSPGTIVHFEPVLKLKPGQYEVSTGFWTPGTRQRLYLEESDVYWINLGVLTVDAEAEETVNSLN